MRVTPAYLSAVATFYDMLARAGRPPLRVRVHERGLPVRNAKAVYDAIARGGARPGLEDVEIREFECLGACDMAPMASVDGRFVGPLTRDDAPEIVAASRRAARCCRARPRGPGYGSRWSDEPACLRRGS